MPQTRHSLGNPARISVLPSTLQPACTFSSRASALAPSKRATDTRPPCRMKRITSAALNRRADSAISTPTLAIRSTYSFLATRTMVFLAPRCFAKSASSKFSLSSSVRQTTQSASVIPSSINRSISVPSPHNTSPPFSCSDKIRQRSLSFSITLTKMP